MEDEKTKNFGYFNIKSISPVVRFLTLADILILGGLGLISPVFAVYIVETIPDAGTEVVGIAMMIYLLTKSIGQIPVGNLIDKIKGERDDFWFLFVGWLFFSLVPLAYIFISTAWQLYLIEFFYGLMAAAVFPSWYAIFTRHMDRDKEGVEWGAYNTLIDLGGALAAGMGGILASFFGFQSLFILSSFIIFLGALSTLFIYKDMRMPKKD